MTDDNDPETWNDAEFVKESVIEDCRESGELVMSGRYLARERKKDGKTILYEATEVIE